MKVFFLFSLTMNHIWTLSDPEMTFSHSEASLFFSKVIQDEPNGAMLRKKALSFLPPKPSRGVQFVKVKVIVKCENCCINFFGFDAARLKCWSLGFLLKCGVV